MITPFPDRCLLVPFYEHYLPLFAHLFVSVDAKTDAVCAF